MSLHVYHDSFTCSYLGLIESHDTTHALILEHINVVLCGEGVNTRSYLFPARIEYVKSLDVHRDAFTYESWYTCRDMGIFSLLE